MKTIKIFLLYCYLFQLCQISATLNFSNDLSMFVLQNNTSNLIINNLGDFNSQDDGIITNLNKINFDESSTYTFVLDKDLILNTNSLIGSDITIQGNDHTIFLNSDLTIVPLSTLRITTTLNIEGNGHTLLLDNFAQIQTDTHSTLSLHNLILKNTNNTSGRPPLVANGIDSNISLNDVKIEFKNNFWFNKGKLFVSNNVEYKESTQFIFNSNQPCYILPQSTFSFANDSFLYYLCDNINNNSVIFQDPSAKLLLNGATLRSTTTGLNLDDGQLLLYNKSVLEGGVDINTGMANINSIKYGTQVNSVAWNPDGDYLAIAGEGPASGAGGFDNIDEVRIYRFDGKTFELTPAISVRYGTRVYTMVWSPDGKYIAIGGQGAISGGGFSNTDELRLYSFNTTTETLQAITSSPYGAYIKSIDWSQSGNYILIGGDGATSGGGFDDTNRIRVYYFSPSANKLNPIASTDTNSGDPVYDLKWRPSGNYLASGEDSTLCIYYFNPFAVNMVDRLLFFTDTSYLDIWGRYYSVTWSNDGQFIITCGPSSTFDQQVVAFKFDPTIPYDPGVTNPLSYISARYYPDHAMSAKFDSSGNFLSIGGYNNGTLSEDNSVGTIYAFDPIKTEADIRLSCVANEITQGISQILTSDWNPNSSVIAYGGNNLNSKEVQIYNFIGESTKLTFADTYFQHVSYYDVGVFAIDWTYDNKFMVVAGSNAYPSSSFPNYDKIRVYRFNRDAQKLDPVTSTMGSGYTGNTDYITDAKWSPDGQFLAVVGQNQGAPFTGNFPIEIYAFNGTQLSLVSTLPTGGKINSVDWHPTGLYLAVGISGKTTGQSLQIYSFDGTTLSTVATDNSTFGGCYFVSWDPTGDYLGILEYTSYKMKIFKFSNYSSLNLLGSITTTSSTYLKNISWTPDSKYIAAANERGNVKIYLFTEPAITEVFELDLYAKVLTALYARFSPDGKNLVACTEQGFLVFCRFANAELVPITQSTINMTISPKRAAWTTDGDFLATGVDNVPYGSFPTYEGPQLFLYKINRLADIYNTYSNGINLNKYLSTTVLGAANVQIDGIIKSSPNTKKSLTAIGSPVDLDYMNPKSVAWSPASNFIAVTGQYATLKIFSVENPNNPVQIGADIATGTGYSASWAMNGNFISLLNSGVLEIYSFNGSSTPTLVASTTPASSPVSSDWSAAGNFIAVVCNDNTLKIFQFDGVSTITQVGSDAGTGSGPSFVSWSKDGNFVAVVNQYDNTFQIFSFDGINTPTQVGSNVPTGSGPICVYWAPSGDFVAVLNDTANTMQIFAFDGINTPTQVGSDVTISDNSYPSGIRNDSLALEWSPFENFIAVASGRFGDIPNENLLQIFSFDGVSTPSPYCCTINVSCYPCYQYGISWSSNGNFITVAGTEPDQLQIFAFE